jgi:hypothetical protein
MKLYTEEQVKELMSWTIIMTVGCVHGSVDDFKINQIAEQKLKSIKPLELPSEFLKGAKWMKEQILNQNK